MARIITGTLAAASLGILLFADDGGASKPAAASRKVFTKENYKQHIDTTLKERIGDRKFEVLVEAPFVVIGDASRASVEKFSIQTVRWAVRLLRKDFFECDPREILEIWLFKDKESYEKNAVEIFNDRPSTPYGYYSSAHGAMIMNIATGGGTLVHEIVHPFVEADFPDCPSWLNEGLGSLFECCHEVDGHIFGMPNWRLPALQEALKSADDSNKNRAMPFDAFTALSSAEFYNDTTGLHYSQARYLCYYLQEKGLLRKFYKDFRAARATDPTGYKTLCAALGNRDMKKFFGEWSAFTLALREDR
ncbi:MAG: hypothetical protein HY286_14145 [Planctomycetes bacterium]|nr:hypothetical protein [Planctomycetota bacterium]